MNTDYDGCCYAVEWTDNSELELSVNEENPQIIILSELMLNKMLEM